MFNEMTAGRNTLQAPLEWERPSSVTNFLGCHPSLTLKVLKPGHMTNSSVPLPQLPRGYHTTVTGGSPKSSRVYGSRPYVTLFLQRVFSLGFPPGLPPTH